MKFFSIIDQSLDRQTDRQTDISCADYFNVIIFRKKRFVKNGSFTNFWFMASRN